MNMRQVQTTEFTVLASLDIVNIDYSPMVLLDGHLSSAITDDPEFSSSCEWGFKTYLGDIEEGCSFGTEDEAIAFVYREMFEVSPIAGHVSLITRAGVILGSLSALAFMNYAVALVGLACFMDLMEEVA